MKSFVLPVLVLATVLAAGLRGASPQADAGAEAKKPVTVILVRHAEKPASSSMQQDPGLTDEGTERARALARLLSHAGVTHLYASEYRRTRSTLAPLATASGLEVTAIPARETRRQLDALRALPEGAVAVVAGHSNTVPALVAGLGGEVDGLVDTPPYGEVLGDDQYDRLFLVTLPAGEDARTQTIELRYGEE